MGLGSFRVYNWSHQINYSISLSGKKKLRGVSTKLQKGCNGQSLQLKDKL